MADYSFSSDRVGQVASDINGKSMEMQECKDTVVNLATSVEGAWQGTDAQTYINALQAYGPEIDKLVNTLSVISSTLGDIKNLMNEREQARAQAAAQQLSIN